MSPTLVKQKFTAWSFSRLKDYLKCAFYAWHKHILKQHKEPEGPAMAKGTEMHTIAAQATHSSSYKKPLHPSLHAFKEEFEALRKNKTEVLSEQEWAFNAAWQPVSWFSKEAWVRIKTDACYVEQTAVVPRRPGRAAAMAVDVQLRETTVTVIDYKSGKIYEDDHKMQRSLYAVGALLMYPGATRVTVKHWYLELGEERVETFEAGSLPRLQKYWQQQSKKMLSDTLFKETPGNHCRWCFLSRAKGGPCKF